MASGDLQSTHSAAAHARSWAVLGLRIVWFVNFAALVGITAWAYIDGRFVETFYSLKTEVQLFLSHGELMTGITLISPARLYLSRVLTGSAVASGLVLFAALFLGPPSHRRLRSWFLFITSAALWLTMYVNRQEIAWLGQQHRLAADRAGFERLAQSLRAEFPKTDGDRPGLGPFMAYPVGGPRMILLLTTPEVSQSGIAVAAVERAPDGSLRFQLTGTETGGWLEWHPPGGEPASFVGGLTTKYDISRWSPLGKGWHLVQYQEPWKRTVEDRLGD
jgi:hypothetical protein